MPDVTESKVTGFLGQANGEVNALERAAEVRWLDLSDPATLAWAGNIFIAQLRAIQYLACEIDKLKAAVSDR